MRNLLMVCVISITIVLIIVYPLSIYHEKSLNEFEIRLNNIKETIIEDLLYLLITEPETIFMIIENHPDWEEIDAVPYSRCYRHLIEATTADYILCRAI